MSTRRARPPQSMRPVAERMWKLCSKNLFHSASAGATPLPNARKRAERCQSHDAGCGSALISCFSASFFSCARSNVCARASAITVSVPLVTINVAHGRVSKQCWYSAPIRMPQKSGEWRQELPWEPTGL